MKVDWQYLLALAAVAGLLAMAACFERKEVRDGVIIYPIADGRQHRCFPDKGCGTTIIGIIGIALIAAIFFFC